MGKRVKREVKKKGIMLADPSDPKKIYDDPIPVQVIRENYGLYRCGFI